MSNHCSLLLVDVDGVLTDGRVYVAHDGERFKAFHSRDNRALAEFVANGWEVWLVSASKWPGLHKFAESTNVQVSSHNPKTKQSVLEITQGRPYYAVGDDVFDIDMLAGATKAFVPRDRDKALSGGLWVETSDGLWQIPDNWLTVLDVDGGCGVIAELARIVFKRR